MRSETKANFKPQTELIPLCTYCAAHSPRLSLLLCISAVMPKYVYTKHIHISLIAFQVTRQDTGAKLQPATKGDKICSPIYVTENTDMLCS